MIIRVSCQVFVQKIEKKNVKTVISNWDCCTRNRNILPEIKFKFSLFIKHLQKSHHKHQVYISITPTFVKLIFLSFFFFFGATTNLITFYINNSRYHFKQKIHSLSICWIYYSFLRFNRNLSFVTPFHLQPVNQSIMMLSSSILLKQSSIYALLTIIEKSFPQTIPHPYVVYS